MTRTRINVLGSVLCLALAHTAHAQTFNFALDPNNGSTQGKWNVTLVGNDGGFYNKSWSVMVQADSTSVPKRSNNSTAWGNLFTIQFYDWQGNPFSLLDGNGDPVGYTSAQYNTKVKIAGKSDAFQWSTPDGVAFSKIAGGTATTNPNLLSNGTNSLIGTIVLPYQAATVEISVNGNSSTQWSAGEARSLTPESPAMALLGAGVLPFGMIAYRNRRRKSL